jgi:two-component system, LytTR family, response regulator
VDLIGVAHNGKDGIALINEKQPNLVFLDVEMDDMTGFEMLERLDHIDFKVIFTTSHDKYAIKAIHFSALYYLLKPIGRDDLRSAIERALESQEPLKKEQIENLIAVGKNKTVVNRIAFTTSDGLIFKNINEIIHCESDRNYTFVHLVNKEKLIVTKTLKELDEMLDGSGFYRIHNSYLVNLEHVASYIRSDGGYVVMSNKQEISISKSKKEGFLELFSKF